MEGGETEEYKDVGYPKRALSLLRDMESIKDQSEAEETVAVIDDKGEGGEEDDDDNWDGNFGKNIQEEGGGGGSGRGDKGGLAKDGSYNGVAQESTPATGSPNVEYYALVIKAWDRCQRWNLRGGGGGGVVMRIYPSSSRRGSST